MKDIHRRILELATKTDIGKLPYRKIGSLLGGEHPYQVQYNIKQLLKTGQLLENKKTGSIYIGGIKPGEQQVINIPIFGDVSCGVPLAFADDQYTGWLTVSPSMINVAHTNRLFALNAVGDSMNEAKINGQKVDDKDFVIIESSEWGDIKNGDYVVSLIGGCANLKKIQLDRTNQRVLLLSESEENYLPIFISNEDLDDYKILGKAVDVIKKI